VSLHSEKSRQVLQNSEVPAFFYFILDNVLFWLVNPLLVQARNNPNMTENVFTHTATQQQNKYIIPRFINRIGSLNFHTKQMYWNDKVCLQNDATLSINTYCTCPHGCKHKIISNLKLIHSTNEHRVITILKQSRRCQDSWSSTGLNTFHIQKPRLSVRVWTGPVEWFYILLN